MCAQVKVCFNLNPPLRTSQNFPQTQMGVGVEPVLLYVSVEFEVIGQVQGGSDTDVEQIKGHLI